MIADQDIFFYSTDRPYNIPEGRYDELYNRLLAPDAVNSCIGSFRALCGHLGIGAVDTALEIGCGTGRFTLGMVGSGLVANALVTDASSTFVKLTKDKLVTHLSGAQTSVRFGVLDGEDCETLAERFDLVVLWAALHHFFDWRSMADKVLTIMNGGGALVISEPCIEFSMTVAPLLRAAASNENVDKEELDQTRINQFCNVLKFRTQRDYPNRMAMEDKHIFRVDDMYRYAEERGLSLAILPNGRPGLENRFGSPGHLKAIKEFKDMVYRRLRFGSGFSDRFCISFAREYNDSLDLLGYTAGNGVGPHFDCVYKFSKMH